MTTKTFDPTKPVQTRDGKAARIICTDRRSTFLKDHPIIALISDNINSETTGLYTVEGMALVKPGSESPSDLVNVVERKSMFRTFSHFNKTSIYYCSLGDSNRPDLASLKRDLPHYPYYLEFISEDDELVEVKVHKGE